MPGAISDHIMYYIILPPRGIPRPGPRVKKRKAEEKQKRSLPRVTIPLLAYFRPDPLADCRLVCFFSSACCLFVCVLQALIACSSPELDYHQHDFIGIRNAMPWELALARASRSQQEPYFCPRGGTSPSLGSRDIAMSLHSQLIAWLHPLTSYRLER